MVRAAVHAQLSTADCWLRCADFAELAGVGRRSAFEALRRCHDGKTWRGTRLHVQVIISRGGCRGFVYQVRVGSLPPALQARFAELRAADPSAFEGCVEDVSRLEVQTLPFPIDPTPTLPPPSPHYGETEEMRIRLAAEIWHATQPGTSARAAMIEEVARREGVKPRTLRWWMDKYEAGGAIRLLRKTRSDRQVKRVIISRAADRAASAAGFPRERWEDIAAALRRQAARCYGDHLEASAAEVALDLQHPFMELCRQTGIQLPDEELRRICLLPRNFVEAQSAAKAVAIYERDKARWSAKSRYRVKRDWSDLLPMGVVAADVYHMDVYVRREDGELATPKAVAFLDIATRRLFIRLFLMEKGQMVRGEHVLQTILEMFADDQFGVPANFYMDHGKEFKNRLFDHVMDATSKLGIAERCEVIRSQPYNPQSKVIETYFAILKRYLARCVGYIGGDRFRKKTERLGRDPQGFPGSFAEFDTLFHECIVSGYHATPQRGHLAGQTPNQRFSSFATSWQAVPIPLEYSRYKLGEQKRVAAQAGGTFEVGGVAYQCSAALQSAGIGDAFVHVPVFGDRSRLPVFALPAGSGAPRYLGPAEAVSATPWNDPGAIAARHRADTEQKRQLLAMSKEFGPILRLRNRVLAHEPVARATPTNVMLFDPEWQRAARDMAAGGVCDPEGQKTEHLRRSDRLRRKDELFDAALARLAAK